MYPQAPSPDNNVTPINSMNYHNPIIPTLNVENVTLWTMAIQCQAQDMGIYDQVININYEPEPYAQRSVADLTSAVI